MRKLVQIISLGSSIGMRSRRAWIGWRLIRYATDNLVFSELFVVSVSPSRVQQYGVGAEIPAGLTERSVNAFRKIRLQFHCKSPSSIQLEMQTDSDAHSSDRSQRQDFRSRRHFIVRNHG